VKRDGVPPRGGVCDVAKLLDFGWSTRWPRSAPKSSDPAGRLTHEGMILGTPAFHEPGEQAAANRSTAAATCTASGDRVTSC